MKYFIFALKSEAQAFIDKYKLGSSKSNDKITILISGIGSKNMFDSAFKIVKIMNKNDSIINIGICGASKNYSIGQLIEIDSPSKIKCVDFEVTQNDKFDIVDMESGGFFEATKNIKNVYMFKVVSDHFEPDTITKEYAKKLIYDNIDEIMKKVDK